MRPRPAATDFVLRADPARFMAKAIAGYPDPWQRQLLGVTSSPPQAGRRVLVMVTRQGGKSSTTGCGTLHRAWTRPETTQVIISPAQRQSSEMIARIRQMIRRVPQIGKLKQDAATSIVLPNGSRIIALPGLESTIRGYTADAVVIDEAARVVPEVVAACRPMLATTGGPLICLTTPKKGTWFEDAWEAGDSQWERIRVTWRDVPRITAEFITAERAAMTEATFREEYECQAASPTGAVFNADAVAAALAPTGLGAAGTLAGLQLPSQLAGAA